ncbi:MAG: phosphate acetyltransferase [Christensenellales bacterium]
MGVIEKLRERAKQKKRSIILPEGTEPRTIQAASIIAREGIADVILLGNPEEVYRVLPEEELSGVQIIDYLHTREMDAYAEQFYELRKAKGMTMELAKETMKSALYYAVMMLKNGLAHGMVAGAINTTGDVLKPGLQVIKTKPGISIVSSCFLMELAQGFTQYGEDGVLLFADCAVNINPDAEQLAAIAAATAQTSQGLLNMEPRIAMLSFSTKGSAKDELVDKVTEATRIMQQANPGLLIDGELQADAALVESVGKLKSPQSKVAGRANILVFPDLQAGNIGYKLVQRLGGAQAIGPICQGLAKPINDLSRGCSVEDIVNMAAITSLQA